MGGKLTSRASRVSKREGDDDPLVSFLRRCPDRCADRRRELAARPDSWRHLAKALCVGTETISARHRERLCRVDFELVIEGGRILQGTSDCCPVFRRQCRGAELESPKSAPRHAIRELPLIELADPPCDRTHPILLFA